MIYFVRKKFAALTWISRDNFSQALESVVSARFLKNHIFAIIYLWPGENNSGFPEPARLKGLSTFLRFHIRTFGILFLLF